MENGKENVRYVMTSPVREPNSAIPVAFPSETKIRNSGSRNKMPGNICVESTTSMNTWRPRNRYRLTAYAAQTASSSDSIAAEVHTVTELTKYRASGTVRHISRYGRNVRCAGIQRNVPVTSCSGFSELLSITYSGRSAKTVSAVRTTRRVQTKLRGILFITGSPPCGENVNACHA